MAAENFNLKYLDSPRPSDRSFKSCNILHLMTHHESGHVKNISFKSEVTKLKAQQLKPSTEEFVIDPDLPNCKFLRSSSSGCITGVWQGNIDHYKKYSSVYHLKFEYNQKPNELNDCPVVSELSCYGPFCKRLNVTDSCEKTIQGRTSLLYVGNTAIYSGRIVLNINDAESDFENPHAELVWHSCKPIFSCTTNNFSEYFAAGTERGCFVFDTINFVEIEHLPGDVLAVEFNKRGNLLYCGIDNDELMLYDLREAWNDEFSLNTCLGIKGVKELKLLSDEWSVVATIINGKMIKLDLRMRKPLFTYPDFCNKIGRRPFSVDEDLNLLCATDDDNVSKIYSLNSGDLLKSIQPLHQWTNSQACLISGQRRWFVAMVQDNVLTPFLH